MNEAITAVGVFSSREQANRAIMELEQAGFNHEQIGMVVRGDKDNKASAAGGLGGTATGAIAGGTAGGILAAVASLAIPAIGPVLAAGVASAVLGGATVGATLGTIVGMMVDQGVPESDAQYYDTEFQAGRTIVTVKAGPARYRQARDILLGNGGYDVSSQSAGLDNEPPVLNPTKS